MLSNASIIEKKPVAQYIFEWAFRLQDYLLFCTLSRVYILELKYFFFLIFFRLPEIPPDTPETNPLLRVKENPDFQKLSPLKIRTGAAKVNIEYETQLGQHLEDLQGKDTLAEILIYSPSSNYNV